MEQKVNRFVYWTPRILTILFLLFLAMFSLDVFEPGLTAWQIAVGLFMHNIPVFVLIAVLVIAWRREWVGGVAFIFAGLLYIASVIMKVFNNGFEWYYLSWILTIAGPAFLIAILFWVNWFKKARTKKKPKEKRKKSQKK